MQLKGDVFPDFASWYPMTSYMLLVFEDAPLSELMCKVEDGKRAECYFGDNDVLYRTAGKQNFMSESETASNNWRLSHQSGSRRRDAN